MTEYNSDQTAQNDESYGVKLPSGRAIFDSQTKQGRCFLRPQSQKSFLNTDSWLEQKQVESLSRERRDLLSEPRAQRVSDLAVAEWIPYRNEVVLSRNKRGILGYMGKTTGDETVLHPFEALFLMESCQLQLLCREVPLSFEEAYEVLLEEEDDLDRFQVYAHLIRAGYTVVLHQGRIGLSSYEKRIGLDRHDLQGSRLTESDSSSESDVVCLNEDDADDSEIEVLGVVPAKQPKLEEVGNECEILSVPDDVEEIPSARRNGKKEADVVFLSDVPAATRDAMRAGEATADCIVVEVDPKPSRLLEFPKFDGQRASLTRPPPHLLPETVFPSKTNYVLDMESVRRECRDVHARESRRNEPSCSRNRHQSDNWRGQWYGGFDSTRCGESSCHREEWRSESWGRDHGHSWRERERWDRSSWNSYSSGNRGSDRSPHAPSSSSPSGWSYNSRRRLAPGPRNCQEASRDEDSYVSVIPKVDRTVSTWAELKAEASRRLNVSTLATGEGASLWKGKVKPLVMPSSDLSIGGIMSQLSVIREVDVVHGRNLGITEPHTKLRINFDVYLPGTAFKKSSPPLPEHRVVCTRMQDGPPRLSDLAALQGPLADEVPLIFAAVDSGNVLLYNMDGITIPNFAPKL